jgi:hypothetical protein
VKRDKNNITVKILSGNESIVGTKRKTLRIRGGGGGVEKGIRADEPGTDRATGRTTWKP